MPVCEAVKPHAVFIRMCPQVPDLVAACGSRLRGGSGRGDVVGELGTVFDEVINEFLVIFVDIRHVLFLVILTL